MRIDSAEHTRHLEQLEAHIKELTSGKYNVMALPDVVAALQKREKLPDRAIAITVDNEVL